MLNQVNSELPRAAITFRKIHCPHLQYLGVVLYNTVHKLLFVITNYVC